MKWNFKNAKHYAGALASVIILAQGLACHRRPGM